MDYWGKRPLQSILRLLIPTSIVALIREFTGVSREKLSIKIPHYRTKIAYISWIFRVRNRLRAATNSKRRK